MSELTTSAQALPTDDASRSASATPERPPVPATPKLEVEDDGWQDTKPAPWRRYFARMLDTLLFAASFSFMLSILLAATAPAAFEALYGDSGLLNIGIVDLIFTTIVPVPFLALLVGLTGTSPGKWLMGVRITRRDGGAIGFGRALRRELTVLCAGMGLGIPFVTLFTMVKAHGRLTKEGVTGWDRGQEWVVTHRPMGAPQRILATLGIASVIAGRFWLQT